MGAISQSGCANLFLAENCVKMKEFGPRGARVPGAPLRSATVLCNDHCGPRLNKYDLDLDDEHCYAKVVLINLRRTRPTISRSNGHTKSRPR